MNDLVFEILKKKNNIGVIYLPACEACFSIIDFRRANYKNLVQMHDKCLISLGFEVSALMRFRSSETNPVAVIWMYPNAGGRSFGKTLILTHSLNLLGFALSYLSIYCTIGWFGCFEFGQSTKKKYFPSVISFALSLDRRTTDGSV